MLSSILKHLYVSSKSPAPAKRKPVTGSGWLHLAAPSGERDRTVYDPAGKPLALKKSDILAHGGEGFVYKLSINANYLVKVCKDETLEYCVSRFV